jgi:uncharacterized protein
MENGSTSHSTPEAKRIQTLDVLRGIALLGILLMNIPFFGRAYYLHYNIDILHEYSGPNYWTWWVVNVFFEGSMRGIFSMLFGAGAILLLKGLEEKVLPEGWTPADVYYRRLIWLLVFGMINAYLFLWPGDILYSYAIVGLFLFPFRNLKASRLLAFGILFLLFSTAQYTFTLQEKGEIRRKGEIALQVQKEKKSLTPEMKSDLEALKNYESENSIPHFKEKIKETNENMLGSYGGIWTEMAGVNQYIQTHDFYHEYFFDVLSFFLIGMALFQFGFLTGEKSTGTYFLVMVLAYAVGVGLSLWFVESMKSVHFDQSKLAKIFDVHPYQIRRLLLAIGHISLVLLIFKTGLAKGLMQILSKVGQMAFTNYLMQTLLCTSFFLGYGFAQFGKLERYQLYEFVVCVWIFQMVFSWIWLHYFKMGPFEWVWRSLTYWKKQQIRRS